MTGIAALATLDAAALAALLRSGDIARAVEEEVVGPLA